MKIPSALDVAAFIIELSQETGEVVTNMKLQKLLYYSQAWYLVNFNSTPLFNEDIQAWQYGPVVPQVYEEYSIYKADNIREVKGSISSSDNLDDDRKHLITEVFGIYGKISAIDLMNLSHNESPWITTYEPEKFNKIENSKIFSYFSEKKI